MKRFFVTLIVMIVLISDNLIAMSIGRTEVPFIYQMALTIIVALLIHFMYTRWS